jgi:3-phosphoshikimate 1-carboxyvinyltransferase
VRVEPAVQLQGHVAVPGDKSISHRAVLFGAIGEGETRITGFGRSADTEATVDAMRALGVDVVEVAHDELLVSGVGLRGLAGGTVDCANAGTLMRLLAGIAAGQTNVTTLTGDESLSQRPMERIAEPLRLLGGSIATTNGHAPLTIEGSQALKGSRTSCPWRARR